MNYFVEGLQGSGKSTLVQRLSEKYPENNPIREGDYSPVELAWCAYLEEAEYQKVLDKYAPIKDEIEKKTVTEKAVKVICYTQVITDILGFHKDLENYEIYNDRKSYDEFEKIVLGRYKFWAENINEEKFIFECSIFQNIIEDLILFRQFSDEEILGFYRKVYDVLGSKDYKIFYLQTENVRESIAHIKSERADADGNEMWFPLMSVYFDESPYAKAHGMSGFDGLIKHLEHRQQVELRICKEIFGDKAEILTSKKYIL